MLGEARRDHQIPWNRVKDSCELLYGCRDLNAGRLQEQYMLRLLSHLSSPLRSVSGSSVRDVQPCRERNLNFEVLFTDNNSSLSIFPRKVLGLAEC